MSEHAIANAKAWLQTVRDQAARLFEAEEVGDDDAWAAACEEIEQSVLSVEIRGFWRSVGTEDDGAEEFRILLTTGGPALRIVGKLNRWGQPAKPIELQWQDWMEPWTALDLTDDERADVLRFASVFYFGEG